jgi:hypothetical protein
MTFLIEMPFAINFFHTDFIAEIEDIGRHKNIG